MKKLFAAAIFAFYLCLSASTQTSNDTALRRTTARDVQDRDRNGKLATLSASEHVARGFVYLEDRHFPEAREHFQKILDVYPTDDLLPRALFGMGRALMWERRYVSAIPYFNRVSTEFPDTKDGREGLAFMGACNVRIHKDIEAADAYQRYTMMYPNGERIESAYLNIIDALREAGKYDDSIRWVNNARIKFENSPTAINAQQARLRMEIYRKNWKDAVATADSLLETRSFSGSMSTLDEIKYLKGLALEYNGKKGEAIAIYASIHDTNGSYFGGLASDRMFDAGNRIKRTASVSSRSTQDFPIVYRAELMQYAKPRGIDPRFVLAIMKQESSFRPYVKSPSAARGLLQLVIDTAERYNEKAGIPVFTPDDLYKPSVNIAIGCAYIEDLSAQFGGLYEAVAASYNGGEDNAARWLNRSNPKEPGIFTAEVGFAETKNYVFKVMTNYRVYKTLYDEDLNRK